MSEPWFNQLQEKWSDQLVLCCLRGFPPCPSLVVKPQPRKVLQGPMNPLAPPLDAVFDREVKCVRRGVGFKLGNTISAYFSEVPIGRHSLAEVKSASRKKAVIIKVRKSSLKVKFKHDAHVERIPKKWAELTSSRKLQFCAPGQVKQPIGKVRDMALRGKARGKVPTSHVLVYCFGDEMYRKVRASTLREFCSAELEKPYGRKGSSVKRALEDFSKRGFSGAVALKEARSEQKRREKEQRKQRHAAKDQQAFRMIHSIGLPVPTPVRSPMQLWEFASCSTSRSPSPSSNTTKRTSVSPLASSNPTCNTSRTHTNASTLPARQVPTPVRSESQLWMDESFSSGSSGESCDEDSDGPRVSAVDMESLIRSRRQQAVPVRLAGMIVPFSEQLDGGGAASAPASADQLTEARKLLDLSCDEASERANINRARRRMALKHHPDKALPSNKEWAHNKWLQIDAAYLLLLGQL